MADSKQQDNTSDVSHKRKFDEVKFSRANREQ